MLKRRCRGCRSGARRNNWRERGETFSLFGSGKLDRDGSFNLRLLNSTWGGGGGEKKKERLEIFSG